MEGGGTYIEEALSWQTTHLCRRSEWRIEAIRENLELVLVLRLPQLLLLLLVLSHLGHDLERCDIEFSLTASLRAGSHLRTKNPQIGYFRGGGGKFCLLHPHRRHPSRPLLQASTVERSSDKNTVIQFFFSRSILGLV